MLRTDVPFLPDRTLSACRQCAFVRPALSIEEQQPQDHQVRRRTQPTPEPWLECERPTRAANDERRPEQRGEIALPEHEGRIEASAVDEPEANLVHEEVDAAALVDDQRETCRKRGGRRATEDGQGVKWDR